MDPRNPYMAPVEVLPEPAMNFPRDASKGSRFVTAMIDQLVTRLIAALGALAVARQDGESGLVFFVSVFAVINIAYYVVLEATTGKTIGKMVAGTKVIDPQGNTPKLGSIFIRTLCRYIPFEPVSFLFGDRGWHDSLSNTRVVRTRGAR